MYFGAVADASPVQVGSSALRRGTQGGGIENMGDSNTPRRPRQIYSTTPASVYEHPDISLGAKALFGMISIYANNSYTAFPSITTLAKRFHLTRKGVIGMIKQLEDAGLIVVSRSQPVNVNGKPLSEVNHYDLSGAWTIAHNDGVSDAAEIASAVKSGAYDNSDLVTESNQGVVTKGNQGGYLGLPGVVTEGNPNLTNINLTNELSISSSPSKEKKPSADFDSLMVEVKKHYPERSDYHQWSVGLKHLKKQLKTQKEADEFLEAVKIYHDNMKAKNNIGTPYVRGFHTFVKEKVYLDILDAQKSIPTKTQPTQKEKTPEEVAIEAHKKMLQEQREAATRAKMEQRRKEAYGSN